MSILALDISTTATGYSIYKDGELIQSGVLTFKDRDWLNRVKYMADELDKITDNHKINTAVIEDTFSRLNVSTLKKLCLAQGIIIGPLLIKNISLEQVYPKEWQSFHGLAKFKRAEIKENSIKIATTIANKEIKTDDEADAILIGKYFSNKENNIDK